MKLKSIKFNGFKDTKKFENILDNPEKISKNIQMKIHFHPHVLKLLRRNIYVIVNVTKGQIHDKPFELYKL